jgi:leucyl-tRNA synthetase
MHNALRGKSMKAYAAKEIEAKWQSYWRETQQYQTEENPAKPKYYTLEQFPYPSGDGLHMGHIRVYSIGDVIARFRRMNGYRVLHPMGADAFGLPAENAAIQRGVNPWDWTHQNMERFVEEQSRMGISYDWERYVATCLPDYYQFTQWLFLFFYERGLAYRHKAGVNWCPTCNTVLANEQVEEGKCWRCHTEVTKKELEQWFLRITRYAEELLEGLDRLPQWPEKVKTMQRNWIGRSAGTHIRFPISGWDDEVITVFTTRVDTLYGVTYLVLAPEHPLVSKLIRGSEKEAAILRFIEQIKRETEIERTSTELEKRGLWTGALAKHPLTGKELPLWIANYVLMNYGTGAVMGVPAHDERDFQFAQKYGLPIEVVIQPEGETLTQPLRAAYVEDGKLVHSAQFNGMHNREAIATITQYLSQTHQGDAVVQYRLHDWLISRQRYWGAPIPIVYCDVCGTVPVPIEQLPVLLPTDVTFDGKRNPLTTSKTFAATSCPICGGPARRETDTMDTFIDSSWYFLRYTDVKNKELPFSPAKAKQWLPVDQYIGGIEHAVLHLLYSRFFTKVLYDAGMVHVDEPFQSLLTQGMVLKDGFKMSKSKGNVVSPLEIIDKYGADTARLFILFAAPPERDLDWSDAGVEGSSRFLKRVWRLVAQNEALFKQAIPQASTCEQTATQLHHRLHQTIKKVTDEINERSHFNTAISAIMELTNRLYSYPKEAEQAIFREAIEQTILLLAPFVPHITEELWQMMGKSGSIHQAAWPTYDAAALLLDEMEIAVQIDGKVREKLVVSANASQEEVEQAALSQDRIQTWMEGKTVQKVVVIPGRLVNIVTK